MGLPVVGAVLAIVRVAAGNPLVDKMITNWTAGTHNKIDDWVWKAIKFVAMIEGDMDKKAKAITEQLAEIQVSYNLLDDQTKKQYKSEYVMADLTGLDKEEIGYA